MSIERVTIKCRPLHSSYECLCVMVEGKEKETYLPYSQIEDKEYGEDNMLCSLSIPKWLAEVRKIA